MAIFSRRTLQRLIFENSEFLRRSQTRDHLRRLNKSDEFFLDAEWEVVLLNAFSKVGKVVHERKFNNGPTPDILFTSLTDPNQTFLAEIATVSDRGLNELYPVEALQDRLIEIAQQHNIYPNYLQVHIGGHNARKFDASKPEIKIPTRLNFDKVIFNEAFQEFINEIKMSPATQRSYRVWDQHTAILIIYNPNERYSATTHPSYTQIQSLVQNTVYNRLEEKAGKLARTNYEGPLAVILCDGGCSLLKTKNNWESYGLGDVIRYFLRSHPYIGFVLIFTIDHQIDYRPPNTVKSILYRDESFSAVGNEILKSLDILNEAFPLPERDGLNAVYLLKGSRPHEGDSFYGKFNVSDNKIRISSRAVLELLAGRVTQENFFWVHHFISRRNELFPPINPFEIKLKQGRVITGIEVEPGAAEQDDDWLVIKFSETPVSRRQLMTSLDNDNFPSEDRKEIKISARELLDLLAGRLEQQELFKSNGFALSTDDLAKNDNPFETNLQQHRLIKRVKLLETLNNDDNLVIYFGEPDPAISPFVRPHYEPAKTKN